MYVYMYVHVYTYIYNDTSMMCAATWSLVGFSRRVSLGWEESAPHSLSSPFCPLPSPISPTTNLTPAPGPNPNPLPEHAQHVRRHLHRQARQLGLREQEPPGQRVNAQAPRPWTERRLPSPRPQPCQRPLALCFVLGVSVRKKQFTFKALWLREGALHGPHAAGAGARAARWGGVGWGREGLGRGSHKFSLYVASAHAHNTLQQDTALGCQTKRPAAESPTTPALSPAPLPASLTNRPHPHSTATAQPQHNYSARSTASSPGSALRPCSISIVFLR